MKKTVIIDGGLGRQISAIPALEKFVKLNPDCIILTYYWTQIFWGNKILTDRIFDSGTKGLFEKIKDTKIIKPEPYHNSNFLNERISMTEAFDEEINDESGGLSKAKIYISEFEKNSVRNRINPNAKTIVFQPFSSTAKLENGIITDNTNRSLDSFSSKYIFEFFKKRNYQVILFDTKGFFNNQEHNNLDDLDFRKVAAVVSQCDYFIGVDSCGNHMANALDIPGTTFFGGTSVKNYGYPDWFKIIQKEDFDRKHYSFRICEFDSWLAEINNDGVMKYTEQELEKHCNDILKDIKDKT